VAVLDVQHQTSWKTIQCFWSCSMHTNSWKTGGRTDRA